MLTATEALERTKQIVPSLPIRYYRFSEEDIAITPIPFDDWKDLFFGLLVLVESLEKNIATFPDTPLSDELFSLTENIGALFQTLYIFYDGESKERNR